MSQVHYARIADLYDQFVQSDFDVAFFTDALRDCESVLELMSGTGRLSLPLIRAGIKLTCVDFSAPMLDKLRDKLNAEGLTATVHHMDVRELALDSTFDCIIIPFHAFPEITDEADQKQALARIRAHLTPSGRFICTLHNPVVRRASIDNQLRLAGRFDNSQGHLFVWLLQRQGDSADQVEVLEFFEQYDHDGVLTHKRWSQITFHLMSQDDFERLAHDAGFEIVALYGDYQRGSFDPQTSPVMIYTLR